MKKLIKYLSLLMIPLAFVLLVSCTAKVVPTYETAWTYDEFVHYHKGEGDFVDLKGEEANHTFSDWTVTKAATYEESGLQERSCTVCGYKQTEAIPVLEKTVVYSNEWKHDATYHWHEAIDDSTDIINHDFHDFDLTVTEATCTEDGFTTFVCKTCGYSFRANYVEALGHTYDRFEMIIEPTEETIGYASLICSRDNHKLALTLPVLSETDYTVTTVASTCSTNGTKTYTYKANSLATITKQLPKAEHTFGDWVIDVEATETTDGSKHHTCLVCGEVEEATVYAISHTHTFGTDWVYDENNPEIGHYHKATCGHTEVLGDLEDHTFEFKSTVAATCTTTGYTVYECSKCGYEYKGDFTSMLGHTYENFEVTKAPTKTTTGLAKATCIVCNDLSEIFLPALTKDNYDIVETPGTCTTKGNIVYTLKTNSAIKITEELDTELGEHDYQFKETVAPTCTERGYSVYECSRCHETENSDYVDALDHDYQVKETVAPTCTEKGHTVYECSICHETENRDYIDALGHDYSFAFNWDETNYSVTATYKCKVCHDENIINVDSTYITNEYSESTDGKKCILTYTVNYDNHTDSISKELDHEYGDWTITTDATTTSTGLKERECTHCGHKDTEVIPAKTDTTYVWLDTIYSGNYYSAITTDMLSNVDTLTSTLHSIISANYTKLSYTQAFNALNNIDSYDGGDYVECIYTGEKMEPTNHGYWNREHVWAKSHGIKTADDGSTSDGKRNYAYSDLHHLRASENSINSTRNNRYFDEVSHNTTNKDNYGNYWNNNNAFEPRDEIKGDIARMLFYMTIRYDGSENAQYLKLLLTDDETKVSESVNYVYQTTNVITSYLGKLSTLVKWSFEDPVDSREISRNNAIYSVQGNRNPFIDHPELVYYVFGTEALAAGVTVTNLEEKCSPVLKNDTTIAAVENAITSIGNVTTESSTAINNARTSFSALDNVSKSFVSNYNVLVTAEAKYNELTTVQDTTVDTTFSFLTLKGNKTGSLFSNKVYMDYVTTSSTSPSDTYGIYSQNSKPVTLTVAGLYNEITKFIIKADCKKNKASDPDVEGTVTISDGINTVTSNIAVGSTLTDYVISVSSLDTSKTWTITFNSGTSWRIREVTFSVS